MNSRHGSVVIIGGGITGLAVAHALKARDCRTITLLESADRLGGTIRTIRDQGFLIEAGPDSFLTVKPDAMNLVHELGIEHELISPSSRSFLVYRNGRLCRIPEGFISLAPTAVIPFLASNLFSLRGRLCVLTERFRGRSRDPGDETLQRFFSRRFGSEFSDNLAEPLFAGIHAGRADELSMLAVLPKFRAMEETHGSITRAVLAERNKSTSSPPALFASLRDGMESLVRKLASSIADVTTRLNCAVTTIAKANGGRMALSLANNQRLEADHVVLAISARAAGTILQAMAPEISQRLAAMSFASSAAVTLAYPSGLIDHRLDATVFVVPRSAGLRMTACSWSTAKWAGRAPDGMSLFRCFFGRHGDTDDVGLSNDALLQLARGELETIVGAKGQPTRIWIHRWPEAMPQYTLGHLERIDEIEALLAKHPGITLAGSSYRGVGIPDCVSQAKQVAERIARYRLA